MTAFLARWRVAFGFLTGILAIVLAKPTWMSLTLGVSVAMAGEALRIWASGHLEKSREVTQSGPYRWMRHPLYIGSSIIGAGFAIAAWSPIVAVVAAIYLGTTIPAAIRAEEAHLREKFGDAYDAYAHRSATPVRRSFGMRRALYNREHHTLAGLLAVLALLTLKVLLN